MKTRQQSYNAAIAIMHLVAVLLVIFSSGRAIAQTLPHAANGAVRQVLPFDAGWVFLQADAPSASEPAFADQAWKQVDLPHDWAIAGPFAESNPSGGAGAFAPAGVGWYRKHFALPTVDRDRRIFVEFDGIMANSDVWMNGVLLGHRPSGYVSLRYELTGHVRFGEAADNVLAVRADNSLQPSSRFYEGAGIYRHARLVIENAVHTTGFSTFVTTPQVADSTATVNVATEIANDSPVAVRVFVRTTVLAPDGRVAAKAESAQQSIASGQGMPFVVTQAVGRPERWELDRPSLYRVQVDVIAAGQVVDSDPVTFGIREFHFDPATGFLLNGHNLKLKGVALHNDVGSLGMAAPLGAWEHRLLAMRQMGVNAIRTAHNPVAPEFLDLCDRMGFLVMDEMFDQWTVAKNRYDYHLYFRDWYLKDTHDTVLRDRNHPSIILYSAGNEIHDTPRPEIAKPILAALVEELHRDDPTRPVTQALFRPNVSHDYDDGLADLLDVVGQNYRTNELLAAHAQKPSRKIVGTEDGHDRATWLAMRDHAEFAGEFLWAGVDYLGESRHWPLFGESEGMYDRTDAPKPDALEHQSWWSSGPVVHLARRVAPTPLAPTDPGYEVEQYRPRQVVFADWTPADATAHEEQVEVYTNCAEVELLLNGRSLGTKQRNADASAIRWSVPFEAGALRADGRTNGAACSTETLRTAGKASKLVLTVERARLSSSWDDVGYLRATVCDAAGTVVPTSNALLHFSVGGLGVLLATDSADNVYHSAFSVADRNAFNGSAIAIVRASASAGAVTVTVSGDGLTPASATLPIQAGVTR